MIEVLRTKPLIRRIPERILLIFFLVFILLDNNYQAYQLYGWKLSFPWKMLSLLDRNDPVEPFGE